MDTPTRTDDTGADVAAAAQRRLLARSASTERFVTGERPRTRGWSHLVAAVLGLPIAIAWVVATPPGRAQVAVVAFGVGAVAMFAASALLHARRWSEATCERLVRVDHTGIYLAIGGTGAAIALLGLTGWPSLVLLVTAVVGTAVGIAVEWLPFAPPRGFSNAVYLTLGWSPIVLVPWLWQRSGWVTVALLLAGGVVYTVGATVVGLRRPRLSPRLFGYHELWHAMVIVAIALHGWMIADLVGRRG